MEDKREFWEMIEGEVKERLVEIIDNLPEEYEERMLEVEPQIDDIVDDCAEDFKNRISHILEKKYI
ncbi:MAG: hypothetical protein ACOCRX_09580 [Candidatus Woesearchaeota archaeon]